ncbi:MAG: AAA family ATPase [Chitinophagaceae bacterium]
MLVINSIKLKNIGPIGNLEINFELNNGLPKPLIIVGKNGTGKSIILSHIVNSLNQFKQQHFDNTEVEIGRVYKYRTPTYIKSGESYSTSELTFDSDIVLQEVQLDRSKKDYLDHFKTAVDINFWDKIPDNENSYFIANIQNNNQKVKELVDKNLLLYFPPNRFEEPAWLNYDNLKSKADFRHLKNTTRDSNRSIINYSPLRDNQNWLLDVLLDKFTLEIQNNFLEIPFQTQQGEIKKALPIFLGYQGECDTIHKALLTFLQTLFQTTETLQLSLGKRRNRSFSILKNGRIWIPSLFNLSTGETALLNIFLTILRDFDLTQANFTKLEDVRGIVVIDEIDLHLHSNHQYLVLPKILKMFPNVQFIATSHSPFFLLGMRNEFRENNFSVIEMPTGEKQDVETFSEFETAIQLVSQTQSFKSRIKSEIESASKAILFVEGEQDLKYILKAAEYFNKKELLENFVLKDANGFGGLDKIYKSYDLRLSEFLPVNVLLLYDCDIKAQESSKGRLTKAIIPLMPDNPIQKGIENLFPKSTIEKLISWKSETIDKTENHFKQIRGNKIEIPEHYEINPDEKKNICQFLIENGTAEDFINFESVFDLIQNKLIEK